MAGPINTTFSVDDYGSYGARCVGINHGVQVHGSQDEAAWSRAFYPMRRSTSSFELELVFPSHASYERFNEWMRRYGELVSRGRLGPMRTMTPARKFDRTAIPSTGLAFGDSWNEYVYGLRLGFVGSADPVEFSSDMIAHYERGHFNRAASIHYHPAGVQLSQSAERNLYDSPSVREDLRQVNERLGGSRTDRKGVA